MVISGGSGTFNWTHPRRGFFPVVEHQLSNYTEA